jgi:hypothetical protein
MNANGSRTPRTVVLAALGLLGVAVIHVLAMGLLLVNAQEVAEGMRRTHYVGGSPVVTHIVFAVLLVLLAGGLALGTGRRWMRIAVTVVLTLQLLAHATLPAVVAILPAHAVEIVAVQAASLVLEIATLWLLWFAGPSRAWFAPGRPIASV